MKTMKYIKLFESYINELNYIGIHKMEPINDYINILSLGDKMEITTSDNLAPIEAIFIKADSKDICYILDNEIYNLNIFNEFPSKDIYLEIKGTNNIIHNHNELVELLKSYSIEDIKNSKIKIELKLSEITDIETKIAWHINYNKTKNKNFYHEINTITKFIDADSNLKDYIYVIPHNNLLISKF
jgi:hypothetical protein